MRVTHSNKTVYRVLLCIKYKDYVHVEIEYNYERESYNDKK